MIESHMTFQVNQMFHFMTFQVDQEDILTIDNVDDNLRNQQEDIFQMFDGSTWDSGEPTREEQAYQEPTREEQAYLQPTRVEEQAYQEPTREEQAYQEPTRDELPLSPRIGPKEDLFQANGCILTKIMQPNVFSCGLEDAPT